jgi:hypothetical protein
LGATSTIKPTPRKAVELNDITDIESKSIEVQSAPKAKYGMNGTIRSMNPIIINGMPIINEYMVFFFKNFTPKF